MGKLGCANLAIRIYQCYSTHEKCYTELLRSTERNMSPEEILRLIREGENDRVEFRAELPPGDLIARTLAAFANSEGGTLLLGVDDSGQIRGLSQEELVDAKHRLNQIGSSLLSRPMQ